MKMLRLTAILIAAGYVWAGSQPTYSDNLTNIDSTKWTQIGQVSAGANGVTGNGALISTVAVPTGNDYDVRMTIHTANQGKDACTGSYTLYARSTPDNRTAYALTVNAGSVGLFRVVASSWTMLSSMPYACGDGTGMRLVVKGSAITFWSGPNMATYQDSNPIAAGNPGVGISTAAGDAVGSVQIGPIGYLPPLAVSASAVQTSTTANRVDLRWPASTANAASADLQGYVIYRDGIYLGNSRTPNWLDQTVTGGESTTYSIYAVDQHGNQSAPATVTVQVPEGIAGSTAKPSLETNLRMPVAKNIPTGPSVDQREIGVRPTGSYWGAAGENIDLLSGNLNFSIPLIKAMGRGNTSVTFALSYNSQMWKEDSSQKAWLLTGDVGLGLGWTLQAGSILPIWSAGTVIGYQYSDATGAQYILDQNNGSNVWSSLQGIYVWFDANADVLHFRDGSFWNMTVVSAAVEADAGTLYPSQMEDSNGNFISLAYTGPAGCGYWCLPNQSSRISSIADARGAGSGGTGFTYSLNWSGSGVPHLSVIGNGVGTSENYTFTMASQTLLDPFNSSNFGTVTTLQSVGVRWLNIAHSFVYNSSGEMTSLTTPLGGVLNWTYANANYTARNYREVWRRSANSSPGGFSDSVYIGSDGNPAWHRSALVTDMGASSQKSWTFSGVSDYTAGLTTGYQEMDLNGTYLQKAYTWGSSSSSNPYVATVTRTLNPGASYAASTTTTQQIDAYGNLTQQQVTDYSGSTTGTRTYNMTYQTQYWNWAAYYILNRPMLTTATPAGGSAFTLANITYGGGQMIASNASNNHDPAYTANGGPPRGNPWCVSGLGGINAVCTQYDSAGVPYSSVDGSNVSVGLTTDSTTNFSLPTTITPSGNTAMNTTATYASSWAPTSMTGPNNAQSTTSYDAYGRPSQTTIPDGATTAYTYTYYNSVNQTGANTQTATVDGRWQTTTLDGFGRTIQVQKGNGSTVVSTVQTQYAACACSPLGKVSAASEPYAPGAPVYWTTYTYDGSGRVLTVIAPDGASTTSYLYQGNSTTVTDPAGKWKTSISDAYGNTIQLIERYPGGTFATNYKYTPANQLTQVSMTRGNVTQTRTFLYTGSDLTSATNPENGTVTYTYDGAHRVLSRVDAVGSTTQYTYDSYGRLTLTQYFPLWAGYNGTTEDLSERVTYSYDSGTNGTGRLTGVSFGGGVLDGYSGEDDAPAHYFTYSYAYSPAGRVLTQTSTVQGANRSAQPLTPAIATFTVGYQWDSEGRMTSMAPSLSMPKSWPTTASFPTMAYQYDINGRMNGMTADSGSGPQTFATASYTGPGQLNQAPGLLYQLSYGGMTETRTYNSMMQLTNQTVPGYLNLTYNYSTTGANNGRIVSSADGITGENTAYTYDALNRLTNASNSLWSEAYVYDGFGNLTSKTGSGGSPNAAPSATMTYNANNQQTTGGSTYDANGNLSGVTGYLYGYTVENKMNSQTSTSNGYPRAVTEYAYDPNGKRVMKETNPDPLDMNNAYNPAWEFYFYSIAGQKLVTMDCNDPTAITLPSCWVVAENTYFGSKLLVSNGVYVVTDRLGSVRANLQGEKFAYYPFGEERTTTVDSRDKFARYFRDSVGQDYADQRYYGAKTGAFFSPDPSGASAADPGNPNSWNMYAYAGGDPINFNDPDGLATSNCGDSLFSYNGNVIGTVSQALNMTANVTILAETEFTEAGHGSSTNSTAEEDMIGEVIMNRWALVNGYWYLYPTAGRPPLDVSAWGSPGGGIDSVTQNGQFAVWNGSSLTTSAQNNLNGALSSAFDSKLCDDLAWAIGSAISFISAPTVNLYYDKATGLAPLAFNSANLTIPSYMGKIGSFGDANTFYGAPVGDFSANLIPLPRPRPVRPPKPPRKPGRPRGGPLMVQ